MSQFEKILLKILSGTSDNNFEFDEIVKLLGNLGFSQRIKGSHFIFYKENVQEILNIQSKGSKAKAYQVRQIREIILKYKLGGNINA